MCIRYQCTPRRWCRRENRRSTCLSISPRSRLAIAAGIRHLVGHARCCPFLLRRDAISHTRYISRDSARAVRRTCNQYLLSFSTNTIQTTPSLALAAGILQLSSRHPGTKTPRRVEETRHSSLQATPRLHIPSFFLPEGGDPRVSNRAPPSVSRTLSFLPIRPFQLVHTQAGSPA